MSSEEISYPSPDLKVLEAIKGNIGIVQNFFAEQEGINLELDGDSIKWIDDYINQNRESLKEETMESLIDIFGSFLGETIINNYDGKWALHEGSVGVHLKGKSWAFPFNKVSKQMHHGSEDSIHSFYTVIPMMLDSSFYNNDE